MLILALDTTTRAGSVALVRVDDPRGAVPAPHQVLAVTPGDARRSHAERMPAEIQLTIERAGVSRGAIDLLAVATGPGAFTGLRIGLATMQGLAMALDRPVAGVSAIDALALEAEPAGTDLVAPWMDAQRGDAIGAIYAAGAGAPADRLIEAAVAAAPAEILRRWRPRIDGRRVLFVGDAAERDAGVIRETGGAAWVTRLPGPLAPAIAVLAARAAADGRAGLPHAIAPIYVRRPDAEIERDRGREPS